MIMHFLNVVAHLVALLETILMVLSGSDELRIRP
jgi:hypothetical protein